MRLKTLYESIKKPQSYPYGVAMLNLDVDINDLHSMIDTEDLASGGIITEHHITLLYGLHIGNSNKNVMETCIDCNYKDVNLDKLSLFKSDEHDVIKYDIDNEELYEMNQKLRLNYKHTMTFPNYSPHFTVAYAKAGKGDHYVELMKDYKGTAKPVSITCRDVFGAKITQNL